ncbi:response regulator [Marinilongibacter aquaticus]|uniref:LytR/AlgR family response regulator transcription factor n=1 Tax=Marinilongibacter aquaticus TaxID=2975157 RepID=UPI0021BD71EA|nr:response regulator [Marinilongibacter aquaticus]UBM59327.1 response regulator [Marinilongibacter aquaticus]
MKSFTAIIVDDEPHAIRTLRVQLEWTGLPLKVLAAVSNLNSAMELIEKHKPDFLFLDVKMPGSNGFELYQKSDLSGIEVIFTTAHDEFALKAFKHHAAGYLTKPLSTDELQSLLEKLIQKRFPKERSTFLTIREKDGIQRFILNQITHISSIGSRSEIHFQDHSSKQVNKPLKELQADLAPQFHRLHHQFLINLFHTVEVLTVRNAEAVLSNGVRIPISRSRKNEFYEAFEDFGRNQ